MDGRVLRSQVDELSVDVEPLLVTSEPGQGVAELCQCLEILGVPADLDAEETGQELEAADVQARESSLREAHAHGGDGAGSRRGLVGIRPSRTIQDTDIACSRGKSRC